MISQIAMGGPISIQESFDLSGQQTRVKRKHYEVIMRLSMALEFCQTAFGGSSVLIAQLDLDNLIEWWLLRTSQKAS
jgi:hypothetical protein